MYDVETLLQMNVLWKLSCTLLATTCFHSVSSLVRYGQFEQQTSPTDCYCNKDDVVVDTLNTSEIGCAVSCQNTNGCVSFHYSNNSTSCVGCRITNNGPELTVPNKHKCWKEKNAKGRQPRDCLDVLFLDKAAEDGVYPITTLVGTNVDVYCIMSKHGGGWTVMLERFNGEVPFSRTFREYNLGFGNKTGEHWLGLRYIHELTVGRLSDLHFLFVGGGIKGLLPDREEYEEWSDFSIGPEPNYTLHIGSLNNWSYEYIMNGGELINTSRGFGFSTKDVDLDNYSDKSSSQIHGSGGWWYVAGTALNPTGEYLQPGTASSTSMYNINFMSTASLKNATVMFRRRDSN